MCCFFYPHGIKSAGYRNIRTFEKIGGEAGLVDGAVGHKGDPELVGAALEVDRLVAATEAAQQGTAGGPSIPHIQVVVGTAVVVLNLAGGGVSYRIISYHILSYLVLNRPTRGRAWV